MFFQEWEEQSISSAGTIDFINPNFGWAVAKGPIGYKILRTINKGVSWDSIYGFTSSSTSENIAIDLVNINLGFIYFGGEVIKTSNGGQNWQIVYNFNPDNYNNLNSIRTLIKFINSDTGYISYTRVDFADTVKILRTINGGASWDVKMRYPIGANRIYKLYDVSFENNNPSIVTFCGYAGFTTNNDIRYFGARSTNGGETFNAFSGPLAANIYQLKYISNLPGQPQNCKMLMVEYRSNSDRGTYCYDFINGNLVSKFKINENSDIDKVGGFKFIDQNLGYVYIGNELYKTTNSGVNWNVEYTTPPFTGTNRNSHFIDAFGDQIFLGTYSGSIYTKKLTTNFQTYFDNQSSPSSIIFDGTQFASPSTQYLRGGYSSLFSDSMLNIGQSNEKIFYKWSDGYFYSQHVLGSPSSFYFDMSGTTIANYYKTKQLSTTSLAIRNPNQSKSIRDTSVNNVTATHTIHESMGGIFYSKSTDFGLTYQTEETVNKSEVPGAADGNKNASLSIIGNQGNPGPITTSDENRNVAVVWEKYNSTTGKIEIKLARRILNDEQNGYKWVTYTDESLKPYVTSFTAPSGFECKPNCFIISSPSQLQQWNTSVIIITYIRPDGNQNKLIASVRYNTLSQDYELENGDIQELSVTSPNNYYSSYKVHFTYLKDANVAYRKEEFGYYNGNIYRGSSPPPEVNNNISANDGYTARYRPDISLMNGLPVVSYAANYNSNAWVSYESGETDIINLHRYPIIKVHKSVSGDWGNYVIYNSTSLQDNPDIEGSSTTQSYLINYKLGNGQFKKVVKVEGQQGYFCEPNTFTGTDSKLIKNSYTGYNGNNLSLLTLSPEASLYRLSKQNFAITNIQTVDQYDNFGGVVNLDTVRYSFNLGPVMIKEPDEELEEVPFGQNYDPVIPVVTPVEFNQNLRSNTFLLNETQALLVGCNATYIKDANDAVINEVK